ncbi:hypothetical protein BDY21DRAFT_398517 [Lineolata rhizophorae]|uniref:SWR1-complex protein 4 n=1 Tax=Lineolata rhizophorae TaxID=578093 RepID=A0A6A6PCI4_9PEZI|nr:hypothetical protein BDY21DRAFT_398517 [Lineolata rhizophorae]
MASSKDVRDIMGLEAGAAPAATAPNKKKGGGGGGLGRRPTGMNRELLALHGERAPPVAVVDVQKTYLAKPQRHFRPSPWEWSPFINPARKDGLVLKHWVRKPHGKSVGGEVSQAVDGQGDTPMAGAEGEDGGQNKEGTNGDVVEHQIPLAEYPYAKYNVEIDAPAFSDEEYDLYMRSNDWSREETDYLIGLVKEYYQRWPVIADRYDFQSQNTKAESQDGTLEDKMALQKAGAPPRTADDLKARYYNICARVMELHTPVSEMDPAEFALHEMLAKFNPAQERQRKEVAEQLLNRTREEIKEEELLLAELQRITTNQTRFEAERAEVRARLEAPRAAPGSNQYDSSTALAMLFNQLFQADRSKKRGRLSLPADALGGHSAAAATAAAGGPGQTPTSAEAHRNSLLGSGGSARKGSLVHGSAAHQQHGPGHHQPAPKEPSRTLAPRAAARFGVSTHERLSSGVTFRTDRLQKLRQAKSAIQTQKIATALAELGIPDFVLPTTRVCEAYAALVGKITKMLDLRKVLEKQTNELKVLRAERGIVMAEKEEGEGKEEKEDARKRMTRLLRNPPILR